MFSPLSPFVEEGRSILAQEFGPEYTNYFSILTSIASGHTRFAEIEQDLGVQVVPYLNNLEKNYGFVRKTLPIFSPSRVRNAAYHIEDMFFRFWFRQIFRNQEYFELGGSGSFGLWFPATLMRLPAMPLNVILIMVGCSARTA